MGQLIEALEATDAKFFGLIENPEGVRALVRELHGQDSGNATAKAGAKVYHEVAESLRKRFNAAGGDVGRLEDWGMPHHQSQLRVAKAGKEAWVAERSEEHTSELQPLMGTCIAVCCLKNKTNTRANAH